MVGKTISHYKILEKLGEGGMGEVFLAQDTSLERKVALKFLPDLMQQDATARKRFLREAKSAAALDHPYICKIYEVGEAEGKDFIAMEYVQGETLREELAKGSLPLKEALQKSAEIAEALEKAHQRGIIHRDLKPSNIMLTPEGHIKVMDFGLAKQLVPAEGVGSQEHTITASLTKTGATLGTLAYMSPEQLRGQEVDTRSDIFSFGIVLYEMLTGIDPFKRPQPLDTASSILKEDPSPLSRYINEVPPVLQHTVKKMLAKEPERRYQHIDELRIDLEELRQESDSGRLFSAPAPAAEAPPLVPRRKNWGHLSWMLATVISLVAALTLAVVHFRELPEEKRTMRFFVSLPEKMNFAQLDPPVISPDGRQIAFTGSAAEGKRLLWVDSLDSLTARALTGTEGAHLAFWSPDSRFIGFFADEKLKKMEHSGGPAQTLCDAPLARGGTWNRHGVIVFGTRREGLYGISEAGGAATPLTTLDKSRGELSHRFPYFLPDGRHFLYTVEGPQSNQGDVYVGSLDSKDVKQLLSDYSNTVYVPPGYLLFVREDTLMAQSFDAKDLQIMGQAFPVVEQVDYTGFGLGRFSASEGGVLAYGSPSYQTQLVWFDREGKKLSTIGAAGEYGPFDLSPDENRVAVQLRDPQSGNRDIWIIELSRGIPSRFTFDPATDRRPVWSPDGSRIVFDSNRGGEYNLYQKPSSGAGREEVLLESSADKVALDWSPDGRFLLYQQTSGRGTGRDLWILPLFGDRKPFPFLQTKFDEPDGVFSPDGQWIAYSSDESERYEVYVRPFPGPGGTWQISTNSGTDPRWRGDGKELFYAQGLLAIGLGEVRKLMAVEVKTDSSTFAKGIPKVLFETPFWSGARRNNFLVTADGQRFLTDMPVEDAASSSITVILNWFEELKRVPTGK